MWDYVIDTDMPKGKSYLVRYKEGITEDWTSQRKTWEQNNDAIGAILGIEDGFKRISEEEVNKIISQYN